MVNSFSAATVVRSRGFWSSRNGEYMCQFAAYITPQMNNNVFLSRWWLKREWHIALASNTIPLSPSISFISYIPFFFALWKTVNITSNILSLHSAAFTLQIVPAKQAALQCSLPPSPVAHTVHLSPGHLGSIASARVLTVNQNSPHKRSNFINPSPRALALA